MRIVANGIESIGTRLLLRLIAAEFSYLAQSSDPERDPRVLFLQVSRGLHATFRSLKEFANSNTQ
jgi:hypothetical protein